MNAYEKAQSLQLTGTDAEIVTQLKTLTASKIAIADLRVYLRDAGMLVQTRNGWSGTLAAITTGPLSAAIDALVDAMVDRTLENIRTDINPQWAGMLSQALGGLVVAEAITAEQRNAVLNLGGGLLYPTLTETEYAAQKTAAESVAQRRAIIEAASATENATSQVYNTRRTRIDSLHDLDLTREQIDDEIATIRTDPETYTLPTGGE
jgi:hypothetical protein